MGSSIPVCPIEMEKVHNFALSFPYDFSIEDNPWVFVPISRKWDPLIGDDNNGYA